MKTRVQYLAVGDVVELQSKITGIVIEKKEVKAKNIVGRGGFLEITNILLSNGGIYTAIDNSQNQQNIKIISSKQRIFEK
jgi:hypothetical protein